MLWVLKNFPIRQFFWSPKIIQNKCYNWLIGKLSKFYTKKFCVSLPLLMATIFMIRICRFAGWAVPLLVTYNIKRFSLDLVGIKVYMYIMLPNCAFVLVYVCFENSYNLTKTSFCSWFQRYKYFDVNMLTLRIDITAAIVQPINDKRYK